MKAPDDSVLFLTFEASVSFGSYKSLSSPISLLTLISFLS